MRSLLVVDVPHSSLASNNWNEEHFAVEELNSWIMSRLIDHNCMDNSKRTFDEKWFPRPIWNFVGPQSDLDGTSETKEEKRLVKKILLVH